MTEMVSETLKSYVGLILSLRMERETQRGNARTDIRERVLQLCVYQGRVWFFYRMGEKTEKSTCNNSARKVYSC